MSDRLFDVMVEDYLSQEVTTTAVEGLGWRLEHNDDATLLTLRLSGWTFALTTLLERILIALMQMSHATDTSSYLLSRKTLRRIPWLWSSLVAFCSYWPKCERLAFLKEEASRMILVALVYAVSFDPLLDTLQLSQMFRTSCFLEKRPRLPERRA